MGVGADETWEKVLINSFVFFIPFIFFITLCYAILSTVKKKTPNTFHVSSNVEPLLPKHKGNYCEGIFTLTTLFYLIFVIVTCILFFAFPQDSFKWITGYDIDNASLIVRPFSGFIGAMTLISVLYWFYVEAYLLRGRYIACGYPHRHDAKREYIFERHLFIDLTLLQGILAFVLLIVMLTCFAAEEASNGISITDGTIVCLTLASCITVYLIIIKLSHTHQIEADLWGKMENKQNTWKLKKKI